MAATHGTPGVCNGVPLWENYNRIYFSNQNAHYSNMSIFPHIDVKNQIHNFVDVIPIERSEVVHGISFFSFSE